jgi:hypothetical protein
LYAAAKTENWVIFCCGFSELAHAISFYLLIILYTYSVSEALELLIVSKKSVDHARVGFVATVLITDRPQNTDNYCAAESLLQIVSKFICLASVDACFTTE